MGKVYHAVVKQGKIYIIYGDVKLLAGVCLSCVLLRVPDLVKQHAGNVLLQNVIGGNLQILVDGQIDIVSRDRASGFLLVHADNLSRAVYIHRLDSLHALQGGLHVGLDSRLTHHIIDGIAGAVAALLQILRIQPLQLLRGDLAGIADDLRKIFAVHITPYGILLDGNALKLRHILHDHGTGLLADVLCDGGTDVFLERGKAHGIADVHHFKQLVLGIALARNKIALAVALHLIIANGILGSQHVHHLVRRGGLFLQFQILYVSAPVHIRQKAEALGIVRSREGILSVFIQNDPEVHDDAVAVLFDQLDQLVYVGVQQPVFASPRLVHILDLDGVGKLVIGKELSVSVVDVSPCGSHFLGFLALEDEIVQKFFSPDDLELKKPVDQSAAQQECNNDHHGQSACQYADDRIFYLLKQISWHLFFLCFRV